MYELLILAFCIGLCRLLVRSSRSTTPLKEGCEPAPRLKNYKLLGRDRLEQILRAANEGTLMKLHVEIFQQYGGTLEQRLLGSQMFGTIEPLNIRAMLTNTDDWGFGARKQIARPLFGDGIFTQEGLAANISRKLIRPSLVYQSYEDLQIFEKPIQNLLDRIQNLLASSTVVDLQPLFFSLTLDMTTAFLFGKSVDSLIENPDTREFAEAFNAAQDYVARRLRLENFHWFIGRLEMKKACKTVQDFALSILESSSGTDLAPESFLAIIKESFTDVASLRDHVINILVAGRDTTASLLSWTIFLLVRHPTVLNKLREEILILRERRPQLRRKDLQQMNYLRMVLFETLRLYPPIPVNARVALQDTYLPVGGGPQQKSPVFVPAGTQVGYSVYSMHRRPDLFGMDAETFRPERWTERQPFSGDPINEKWAFLPFNGGPRRCLGYDLAFVEAAYTVIRILETFPNMWGPHNDRLQVIGAEKQTVNLTMSISDGCKVAFK